MKSYAFRIQPQEVDFQYKVTLAWLTNILLTTAGFNADENGFGIRNLNENDCSWVLLRLAVEMDIFPEQYENIQVETWVEEVGRASTTRDFIIRNERNEPIGKATSNWAMININTRRAQDLATLEGIHQHATGTTLNMEKPVKLTALEGNPVDVFRVKYSHIDINGHTNSMRYVEWVSDCFSPEVYKAKNIKRFEINFVNEILFGEEVSIFVNEKEKDDFRFEIRKENKTACKARIVFDS
jgi:acyl-ACP thioesterase